MEELKDELQSAKADELERNLFDKVMTIKQGVLDKSGDQSERVFLNSLLKLHCMPLSVKILETRMIEKSVGALRNHTSKNIRDIVRMIITDWRLMVDSWLDAIKKKRTKKKVVMIMCCLVMLKAQAIGVTDEVEAFVRDITMHPETWLFQ